MEDIKKSILDTFNERITSPLVGSFVISWAIWNYKTILIFLSTKSVEDKFQYIEETIYSGKAELILNGLLFPTLTSLAFILLFPYPEKWIYEYWYGHKQKLKSAKNRIDSKRLLTMEESRDLTSKVIGLESRHDEELEKKNIEIKKLKEIITEHNREVEEAVEELEKDGDKIADDRTNKELSNHIDEIFVNREEKAKEKYRKEREIRDLVEKEDEEEMMLQDVEYQSKYDYAMEEEDKRRDKYIKEKEQEERYLKRQIYEQDEEEAWAAERAEEAAESKAYWAAEKAEELKEHQLQRQIDEHQERGR